MNKTNDNVEKICKCGRHYFGVGAISRRDNKTEICPECGLEEALTDYFGNNYKYENELEQIVVKIIDLKRNYFDKLSDAQKDNLQFAISFMLKAEKDND